MFFVRHIPPRPQTCADYGPAKPPPRSLHTLGLCVKLPDSFPPTFPFVVPPCRYVASTYLLCLPLTKTARCVPKIPTLEPVHSEPCRGATHHSLPYSSSFFSHSCALFCTLLHSRKTQLISFQAIPHSGSKNHSTWGAHSIFAVQSRNGCATHCAGH